MVEIRKLTPAVGPIRMPAVKTRISSHEAARAYSRFGGPTVIVRRRSEWPIGTPLETPCVLWQGTLDSHGYALKGKVKMHRWVMNQFRTVPLKPHQFVLHRCDTPACYRYDHLSIGTVQTNNADMVRKKRNKPPPVNRHQRGEKHPRAKITQQQVDHILELYRKGFTQATIADLSGISKSQVSRICRGINWRASTKEITDER
jgi:hypothetical protein